MVDWVVWLRVSILICFRYIWVFIMVWIIVGIGIVFIVIVERTPFKLPDWVDNVEDEAHLVVIVDCPRISQSRCDNVEDRFKNQLRICDFLILIRIGEVFIIIA